MSAQSVQKSSGLCAPPIEGERKQMNDHDDPLLYLWILGTALFNEASRELHVDGEVKLLSERRYKVLRALLRAGRLVTREELHAFCWGGPDPETTWKAERIVSWVRIKLGTEGKYIQTIRKTGWQMAPGVKRVPLGKLHKGMPFHTASGEFLLEAPLGKSPGLQVWIARERRTSIRRVFRIALDEVRLQSLKEELRCYRELEQAQQLDLHPPGVVKVFSWSLVERPYFMELEDAGQDLASWIRNHPEDPRRLQLLLMICDIVKKMHSVSLLHGNLKPSQIHVVSNGPELCVRISDWGSGRMLDDSYLNYCELEAPRVARFVNADSAAFVAPELLASCHEQPTQKSDAYSLAQIGKLLLAGVTVDERVHQALELSSKPAEKERASVAQLAGWLRDPDSLQAIPGQQAQERS
jgi:DNA-binding winged helix-turn-helix (wHTH) protein